jgi:hypothetical protein
VSANAPAARIADSQSKIAKKNMTGLYPIIRRVRRPLLPVDPPVPAKKDASVEHGVAPLPAEVPSTKERALESTAESLGAGAPQLRLEAEEQRGKRAQEDDATLF